MVDYRLIMKLSLQGRSYRQIQQQCGAAHATIAKARNANEIFNLLAAREGKGSTIVTSQFAPDEWYESMPDRVVAESLLNRLIGGAEIINIDGPNMRLTPTVTK